MNRNENATKCQDLVLQSAAKKEKKMEHKKRIAIIGGGVSGSTTALHLSGRGTDVTLFEKAKDISSGPPYCHLHAGGNLYREISDAQCLTLLQQSIRFARAYPYAIDRRPTVIALPVDDPGTPGALIPRLEKLRDAYAALIENDPENAVLGCSEHYYRLYGRDEIDALAKRAAVADPVTADEWMIPAVHALDLDKLQYPLLLVQEYGINLFRYAAGVTLSLQAQQDVTLRLQTEVQRVEAIGAQWHVSYSDGTGIRSERFDYLINASGFRTGSIDDMVGVNVERMVEFKASYVSRHAAFAQHRFPEIIIHGRRGTPRGMAQFTPYAGGYFQLHGMSEEITLYSDGLAASTKESAQPRLEAHFIDKLDHRWEDTEIESRTCKAIEHVARFIPDFAKAVVGAKPLFGAQQIPGIDPTLRVAEVSFPRPHYARCEIVKVSSALDMADAIVKQLVSEKIVVGENAGGLPGQQRFYEEEIRELAGVVAQGRNYPTSMANLTVGEETTRFKMVQGE